MKRSEWGLFTGASFLLAVAFPPYFLELIAITFLGGIGLLWRSLRASDKIRLAEFEKKFRLGYRRERAHLNSLRGTLGLGSQPRLGQMFWLATTTEMAWMTWPVGQPRVS